MILLNWRDLEHCKDCKYFEEIKIDKIKCSYPYPDKKWFWKRQTNDGDKTRGIPPYPKKLKVKVKV